MHRKTKPCENLVSIQHTLKIGNGVARLLGFLLSILEMRSLHSFDTDAHFGGAKLTSLQRIASFTEDLEDARKGGTPHMAKYVTTRVLHMSISEPLYLLLSPVFGRAHDLSHFLAWGGKELVTQGGKYILYSLPCTPCMWVHVQMTRGDWNTLSTPIPS